MAEIDWTKEVLPQMSQVEDTEGIEAVQQILYDATPEQIQKFKAELKEFQERVLRKIAASAWN